MKRIWSMLKIATRRLSMTSSIVNFEHTPHINQETLFQTLSKLVPARMKGGHVIQLYLCIKKTINSSKNIIFMKYFEFTKELLRVKIWIHLQRTKNIYPIKLLPARFAFMNSLKHLFENFVSVHVAVIKQMVMVIIHFARKILRTY